MENIPHWILYKILVVDTISNFVYLQHSVKMEIERNVNRTSDPDTQTALLRSSTWKNHGSDSLVTGSEYTANDQGAENDSTAENSSNQTPPSSYRHAKTLATFISFAGIVS